jgi:SAM-dependent methyltransferase
MKQNKYDDATFFSLYEQMPRSVNGLEGAGEWHQLKTLLPDLLDKKVLDLGCGFGWHCRYAREKGANRVVGVDLSERMLARAREMTHDSQIIYLRQSIEDIEFADSEFDVVFSSLAFHYIESFELICKKVYDLLAPDGSFIFSVEHPVFTCRQEQDWCYDADGNRSHWPVDHYQSEGLRRSAFLTGDVIKYHRTISTYFNNLIEAGFRIQAVNEPVPPEEMLKSIPEMKDELRRPIFLMISAKK